MVTIAIALTNPSGQDTALIPTRLPLASRDGTNAGSRSKSVVSSNFDFPCVCAVSPPFAAAKELARELAQNHRPELRESLQLQVKRWFGEGALWQFVSPMPPTFATAYVGPIRRTGRCLENS